MNKQNDFSDVKIGDKVTDLRFGHGVIHSISKSAVYPVCVSFGDDESLATYDKNGFYSKLYFAPTLFRGHINSSSLSITYNTINE